MDFTRNIYLPGFTILECLKGWLWALNNAGQAWYYRLPTAILDQLTADCKLRFLNQSHFSDLTLFRIKYQYSRTTSSKHHLLIFCSGNSSKLHENIMANRMTLGLEPPQLMCHQLRTQQKVIELSSARTNRPFERLSVLAGSLQVRLLRYRRSCHRLID